MIGQQQCCFVLEKNVTKRREIAAVARNLGLMIVYHQCAFTSEQNDFEPDLVVFGHDVDVPQGSVGVGSVELLIRESQAPVLCPPEYKDVLLEHFDNVQVYAQDCLLEEMSRALLEGHIKRRLLRNDLVKAVTGIKSCEQAEFHFKTLEEAQALALLLATLAPEKKLLRLGLSELFINAVEHGNLGISGGQKQALKRKGRWLEEIETRLSQKGYADKYVRLRFSRDDKEIHLSLLDEGKGFDWREMLGLTLKQKGAEIAGRGILIAKKSGLNTLEYLGSGNELTCSFSLGN
jgi:anti-sigma regulatory factor (Ser/Thr protein kinase)